MGLFRPQAIAARQAFHRAEILVLPRVSHLVIAAFLCTWLLLSLAWLVNNAYAPKALVTGWLTPVGGVTRVYAGGAGLVSRVLVKSIGHTNGLLREDFLTDSDN